MNADFTDDSDSDYEDHRNRTWSDFSDIMDDEVALRVNRYRCINGFLITSLSIGLVYTYYYIMTSL